MEMDWRSEQLPQELLDLFDQIDSLPGSSREQLRPLCDRVCHIVRLQKRLVRMSEDTVATLQLRAKYLLFDLEVTRRERNALHQELREQADGK